MTQTGKYGQVIWLTGISGAGKTTLALALVADLKAKGVSVELLDGDIVRDFFENDLGYTRKERILNVKRIAFAAKLLADHGVCAVVANIAPFFEVRDFIRKKLPHYTQVYVKVSVDGARKRDVKGHYKKSSDGKLTDLIGVDDGYDEPRRADLVLDTEALSQAEAVKRLLALAHERLKL